MQLDEVSIDIYARSIVRSVDSAGQVDVRGQVVNGRVSKLCVTLRNDKQPFFIAHLRAQVFDWWQLHLGWNDEAGILDRAAENQVLSNRGERRGADFSECGAERRAADCHFARFYPLDHLDHVSGQVPHRQQFLFDGGSVEVERAEMHSKFGSV